MINRKIWGRILCFVLATITLASCLLNRAGEVEGEDKNKEIELRDRVSLALPNSTQLHLEANGLLLQKTKSSHETYIRSMDQITVYKLFDDGENVGSIKVTVREIDNGISSFSLNYKTKAARIIVPQYRTLSVEV